MLEANNLKLLISILKQDRNNHFFCYNYFNHNLTQISKSPNPEISNSQFEIFPKLPTSRRCLSFQISNLEFSNSFNERPASLLIDFGSYSN